MSAKPFWWGATDAAPVLQAWHQGLAGDAAARAALRRIGPAADALAVPAYAGLVRELRAQGYQISPRRAEAMTAEAVAVAEVGESAASVPGGWNNYLVAKQLAGAWAGAGISRERLRVLLGTEASELFLRLLRGALSIMRSKNVAVSVIAVAETVRRHRSPDLRQAIRRAVLFEAAMIDMFKEPSR